MSKKIVGAFLVAALIIVAAVLYDSYTKHEPALAPDSTSDTSLVASSSDLVADELSRMSVDEKIGQLLIVGFEHPYVDDHIRIMIQKYHIGGINLFGRNVTSLAQTTKLDADLQKVSSTTLFIGTDQEGGNYERFKSVGEQTSEPDVKTPEQAYAVAYARAEELKALGVNMDFSPVLDHVTDPKSYLYARTFATSSEVIGRLGESMIEGYIAGGVVPVAKHFPGYGNIIRDPHRNGASISLDQKDLDENLLPFKTVIQEGVIEAIMTAHVVVPLVDSRPATFSEAFLKGILRDQFGFKGVIITDDLEMAAAGTSTPIGQLAVDSIQAGTDMIISTYTPGKQIEIFNAIKQAVSDGSISMDRLDQSVGRILLLKAHL